LKAPDDIEWRNDEIQGLESWQKWFSTVTNKLCAMFFELYIPTKIWRQA